jgi:hypothetical protein
MAKYIPEVLRLSWMPGGLEVAFHLILFLGTHTYDLKERNLRYCENRPTDKGLDELLRNVAHALRRENPTFNPTEESKKLAKEIEESAKRGFNTYFTNPFDLLLCWEAGPKYIQRFHKDIKTEISAGYTKASAKSRQSGRASGIISSSMVQFIPRIRRLGKMSSTGLHLAFELVLLLGRHSYDETPSFKNRPYDPLADALLVELITDARLEDPNFRPVKEIKSLKNEMNLLAEYDIHSYFPGSFKLLSKMMPDIAKASAVELYETCKLKITKANKGEQST